MKLYAVYWTSDQDKLDSCLNAWWKDRASLGSYKDAAMFTEEEAELELKTKNSYWDTYGSIIEIEVNETTFTVDYMARGGEVVS